MHREPLPNVEKLVRQITETRVKRKMDGGLMAAIKNVKDKQAVIKASNGKAYRKRNAKDPRIARGCGNVLNERRKKTKIT
jgi:hypothetical protein